MEQSDQKKSAVHHGQASNPAGSQHGVHKSTSRAFDVGNLNLVLAGLLLVSVVFGIYLIFSASPSAPVVPESPGLPKVEVLFLDPGCDVCVNLSNAAANLKSLFNVTSERTLNADSLEAGKVIEKYNVSRLPAVVLSGDVDKANVPGFVKFGDALVSSEIPAPFVDASSLEVVGRVRVTLLERKSCSECQDVSRVVSQLKQLGVLIDKESRVDSESASGASLIEKYQIERLPTLIFSSDAKWYPQITEPLKTVGSVESDGSFVWREVNAPYFDVKESRIRGILSLQYLNDSSCAECYPVVLHKQILAGSFGAFIGVESSVDISSSEGKSLLKKYNVTKVPTVLVSGDVSAYPSLVSAWADVGSVVDGVYVFNAVEVLQQPYKDLVNDTIVGAEVASSPDSLDS